MHTTHILHMFKMIAGFCFKYRWFMSIITHTNSIVFPYLQQTLLVYFQGYIVRNQREIKLFYVFTLVPRNSVFFFLLFPGFALLLLSLLS